MFTGIIQAVGQIVERRSGDIDSRLIVAAGKLGLDDVGIGDSIAVSGVCLTVVGLDAARHRFVADVSRETLDCTVLGDLQPGDALNLEKALTLATPLGGHLVSGHVDGIARVSEFYQQGRSWRLGLEAPAALARYIAAKGSVCVDGVSLTVNGVDNNFFTINLIPHTLQETTLGDYRVDRRVNLEVDLIARYLERMNAYR